MIEGICPQCGEKWQTERAYPPRRFCGKACQIHWMNDQKALDLDKRRRQARESHHRHRDKNNAIRKQHYLAHRDENLMKLRQWYADHREEELPKHRAWHAAHREEANAGRKARYWADPETGRQKGREYLQRSRLKKPYIKLLNSARTRAKTKNLAYDLTLGWAEERWTGYCEVSGLRFSLGQPRSGPKVYSPSIDRIDPALGYIEDNCRFVLWAVNALKHDGMDSDMIQIALAIADRFREQLLDASS